MGDLRPAAGEEMAEGERLGSPPMGLLMGPGLVVGGKLWLLWVEDMGLTGEEMGFWKPNWLLACCMLKPCCCCCPLPPPPLIIPE